MEDVDLMPVLPPCGDASCVLQEILAVDPRNAHTTRWARSWSLAPRHARVAAYLLRGWSDRRIAEEIGLSLATVRTYVKRIMSAAGASNRAMLLHDALRMGMARAPLGDEVACSKPARRSGRLKAKRPAAAARGRGSTKPPSPESSARVDLL